MATIKISSVCQCAYFIAIEKRDPHSINVTGPTIFIAKSFDAIPFHKILPQYRLISYFSYCTVYDCPFPAAVTAEPVVREVFMRKKIAPADTAPEQPCTDIQCTRLLARNKLCAKVRHVPEAKEPQAVQYVLADSSHKLLLVVVPKAGSISWRHYFDRLHSSFRRHVPVEEINTKYKDYLKFVMVRHPLQRFVSGYYEVIVKRGKYTDLWCKRIYQALRNGTSCDPNHNLTLSEFARAFSMGLLPENEHWRSQQLATLPCDIQSDLILKVETSESDVMALNERLDEHTGSFPHLHKSRRYKKFKKSGLANRGANSDLTKYDRKLRRLQKQAPEAFRWLLRYFQTDMEMFGYTWKSARCGCSYSAIGKSNVC